MFNKKETLNIRFARLEHGGLDFLEPIAADRMIPDWYKNIEPMRRLSNDPNAPDKDLTIKKCIPVLDALTSGYFMITKHDVVYSEDKDGNSMFSLPEHLVNHGIKPVTMHPFEQVRGIELNGAYKEYAFKWSNPYVVITPPGYSCIYTHPMNHFLPFHSLSGVVDTDTYPLSVQFPFLMIKDFNGVIPKGTPVIQIIPFKRDDWKMDGSLKTTHEEEMMNKNAQGLFDKSRFDDKGNVVGGRYKKRHRVKKRYS